MRRETRDLECRLAPADDGTIEGYAAVWGRADAFGDVLVPGAFAASVRAHQAGTGDVLMLWHHRVDTPIGTWTDLREDGHGLKVRGQLVLDSTGGRDAFALMKAGAVKGLSIGFNNVRGDRLPKGGRRVRALDLVEISPVTLPAQPMARIGAVRSHPVAAGLAAFIRDAAGHFGGKTR